MAIRVRSLVVFPVRQILLVGKIESSLLTSFTVSGCTTHFQLMMTFS